MYIHRSNKKIKHIWDTVQKTQEQKVRQRSNQPKVAARRKDKVLGIDIAPHVTWSSTVHAFSFWMTKPCLASMDAPSPLILWQANRWIL